MLNKIILKLQSKKAEMYVSKTVWTLGVIIVGMALVWGFLTITNATVLPGLTANIATIFESVKDEASGDNSSDFTNTPYVPAA